MVDNLDSFALTIMGIEAVNGRTDVIIASPSAWATLITLKTGTVSNASLVGAGVESAARQLLGVEVIDSSAMTADQILVLGRSAVLSASGNIHLATSTDVYFTSDSVAVRVTWRFGQVFVDTDRMVRLAVTAPA